MATYFYSIRSLVEAIKALIAVVTDPRFTEGLRGKAYRAVGLQVRTFVLDDEKHDERCAFIASTEPILATLRRGDCNTPMMGKAYYFGMSTGDRVNDAVMAQDDAIFPHSRSDGLVTICTYRMGYVYHDYHGAGYLTDPE
jgi:hypothetical protein